MSLSANSYSSVAEVVALTRHLLDGQPSYNLSTRPTLPEVEKIIDQTSAELNLALAAQGFSVPLTNATAVLACGSWVAKQAARTIEQTQRSAGWTGDEAGPQAGTPGSSMAAAEAFAKSIARSLHALDVPASRSAGAGLAFTGMDAQVYRDDPADPTMEQPMFKRRLFDL